MNTIIEELLDKKFPATCAFRGQEDARWDLNSSAIRRLKNYASDASIEKIFMDYHVDELIEPARKAGLGIEEGHELPDLQLLAKLQHFGAATGLLDFTWNPLVALWFACRQSQGQQGGKVFVVDLNSTANFERISSEAEKKSIQKILSHNSRSESEALPLYWEPGVLSIANSRILRQRSVFVVGRPLIPAHVVRDVIEIKESEKREIIRQLEEQLDINERSLFMDAHGFASINRVESPIRHLRDPILYMRRGNRLTQEGDYDGAIENYNKSIEIVPDVREPYFLRGNAKAAMQDYRSAKKDYDQAIARNNHPYHGWTENTRIVNDFEHYRILFNRGNVQCSMEKYRDAVKDYNKAECAFTSLDYGSVDIDLEPIFFNRGNAKAMLKDFEGAIRDYDKAIDCGSKNAYVNKADVLLRSSVGKKGTEGEACFSYMMEYYGKIGEIGKQKTQQCKRILERISGREYSIEVDPVSKTLNDKLVLRLKVDNDCGASETFAFIGRVGNTGNFGGNRAAPGKGFPGQMGVIVIMEGYGT